MLLLMLRVMQISTEINGMSFASFDFYCVCEKMGVCYKILCSSAELRGLLECIKYIILGKKGMNISYFK